MSTFTSCSTAIAMFLVGCTSKPEPPPPPREAPPIASHLDGKRAHGMLNCPSGVEGATTKMTFSQFDVPLTITASEANAQRKIVTLAHAQALAGNPHGGLINNGSHGGPGSSGFCPIIHADTVITVDEINGGVIVHVRPNDPAKLEALRAAIEARVTAIAGASS